MIEADWEVFRGRRGKTRIHESWGFMERYSDGPVLVLGVHFATPSAGKIVSEGDVYRFEARTGRGSDVIYALQSRGNSTMTTKEEKLKFARMITTALPAPEEIRDDWGCLIHDTVLPDGVWSRPGLATRERSLITIAALCVLYRPNELKIHIGRGLDNGLTRAEISEVIMHLAIYGGFPTSVEGMAIARDVFDARDASKESDA
jgi:4-carboxymuconolactone decarboxylase